MSHEQLRSSIHEWLGSSTADCSSQILPSISETQPQLRPTQLGEFDADMDDIDSSSTVSRSTGQTSFALRPTLVPTPPSTKRGAKGSRSPSPTRKLLALLEFDEDAHSMSNELENMWQQVNSVYVEAERCQKHHKDENAWVMVICAMLRIAGMGSKDDMLELNSVQTQSIDSSLLPTLPENVLPFARKADLALAFSPHHGEVTSKLNEIKRLRPGMSLSQMSDAYTSTVILGCGMEVKESGGDYISVSHTA